MTDPIVILEGNGALLAPFLFHGDEYRLRFTQSDATPVSIEKLEEVAPGVAQWCRLAQAVRQRGGGLGVDSRTIGNRADHRLLEAAGEALNAALAALAALAAQRPR